MLYNILIFIAVLILGFFIGRATSNTAPMIGSLDFNMADPSKEFLALKITEDINLNDPPMEVTLKVNVLKNV